MLDTVVTVVVDWVSLVVEGLLDVVRVVVEVDSGTRVVAELLLVVEPDDGTDVDVEVEVDEVLVESETDVVREAGVEDVCAVVEVVTSVTGVVVFVVDVDGFVEAPVVVLELV